MKRHTPILPCEAVRYFDGQYDMDEHQEPTPSDRRWCIAVLTVGIAAILLLLAYPVEGAR